MSSVKTFFSKVYGDLKKRAFMPRVRKAGDAMVVQLRLNIGIQGPPHSLPGEFPRRITGYLSRAIDTQYDEDNLTAKVFVRENDAPYWRFLEFGTKKMEPRTFLSRTLREMKPRLRRKLIAGD